MYWRQVVSQSPISADEDEQAINHYIDSWEPLNQRILTGSSFSGRERHCCFLNTGQQQFVDISAASGLHLIDDGRAIAVTDWDQDGDLDIWLTNRTSPRVRFLRNDMPTDNSSVTVLLEGDPTAGCSRDAFGARVQVVFKNGNGETNSRSQTLYGGDSFLSQSTKWMYFGTRRGESIESVTVRWPGATSVETFQGVQPQGRWLLRQGTGAAERVAVTAGKQELETKAFQPKPLDMTGRLRLSWLKHVGEFSYRELGTDKRQTRSVPANRPTLVTFWASWCAPCREELTDLANADLKNIDVVAMNIESAMGDEAPADAELTEILDEVGFRGLRGVADAKLVLLLNERYLESIYMRFDLPLPVSFLIDEQGDLRAVYKGRLDIEQLKQDVATLDKTGLASMSLAVPFPGRWSEYFLNGNPVEVAKVYIESGNPDDAKEFLRWYIDQCADSQESDGESYRTMQQTLAGVHYQLGRISYAEKDKQAAYESSRKSLEYSPDYVPSLLAVISHLVAEGDFDAVKPYVEQAGALAADHPRVAYQLGVYSAEIGDTMAAINNYQKVLRSNPRMYAAANNLAWLLATHPDESVRDGAAAVRYAKQACEATGYRRYVVFDALAAAHAESGNFVEAVAVMKRATAMATAKGDIESAQLFGERTRLYESQKPYREASRETSDGDN